MKTCVGTRCHNTIPGDANHGRRYCSRTCWQRDYDLRRRDGQRGVRDLTGQKIGMLSVARRAGSTGDQKALYLCDCDCGGTVEASARRLRREPWRWHCGCQSPKPPSFVTGPISRTPEYSSWAAMRSRCLNPNATSYERYGGRGIKICPEWDDPMVFIADMGKRPPGTTLDRIDGAGDYKPGNCRWATDAEQATNRRRPIRHPSRKLEAEHVIEIRRLRAAEGLTFRKLAERFEISPSLARAIVNRDVWRHVP